MEKFVQFLNFVSYKYHLSFEDLSNDFKEFVKEEKERVQREEAEEAERIKREKEEEAERKRLIDFASGLVFGHAGTIERVTSKVFLLTPPNVTVSGEEKSAAAQASFFNQS